MKDVEIRRPLNEMNHYLDVAIEENKHNIKLRGYRAGLCAVLDLLQHYEIECTSKQDVPEDKIYEYLKRDLILHFGDEI